MGGKSWRPWVVNSREFILKNAAYIAGRPRSQPSLHSPFVTDAPAYAGTASATCANCHVMDSMYENYYHGAHHAWAVCADCHLPHTDPVTYYVEKGRQGMHDVYVFGTGTTPQMIHISEHSKQIVQKNCVRCHELTVELIVAGAQPFERDCWECHRNVAHGAGGAVVDPYQDSSLYSMEQGE